MEYARSVVTEVLRNHPSAWFWTGASSSFVRYCDLLLPRTFWVGKSNSSAKYLLNFNTNRVIVGLVIYETVRFETCCAGPVGLIMSACTATLSYEREGVRYAHV